jgi:alpha-1,2-glucosyltransferase
MRCSEYTLIRRIDHFIRSGRAIYNALSTKPWSVSRTVIPYLPTFVGFLVFLKWNGGIVLGKFRCCLPTSVQPEVAPCIADILTGHKENHEPVLHLPQVYYFVAFATIFLHPVLLNEGLAKTVYGTLSLAVGTSRYATNSPARHKLRI